MRRTLQPIKQYEVYLISRFGDKEIVDVFDDFLDAAHLADQLKKDGALKPVVYEDSPGFWGAVYEGIK